MPPRIKLKDLHYNSQAMLYLAARGGHPAAQFRAALPLSGRRFMGLLLSAASGGDALALRRLAEELSRTDEYDAPSGLISELKRKATELEASPVALDYTGEPLGSYEYSGRREQTFDSLGGKPLSKDHETYFKQSLKGEYNEYEYYGCPFPETFENSERRRLTLVNKSAVEYNEEEHVQFMGPRIRCSDLWGRCELWGTTKIVPGRYTYLRGFRFKYARSTLSEVTYHEYEMRAKLCAQWHKDAVLKVTWNKSGNWTRSFELVSGEVGTPMTESAWENGEGMAAIS